MKKLCPILVFVVLAVGCASGLKTKRIGFICDPQQVIAGRDVLVNVVYFDAIQDAVTLSQNLEKKDPHAWFGGGGAPQDENYDRAIKQPMELRTKSDVDKPQFVQLDRTKLKHAQALVIIADYGARKPEPGSKTVIELDKTNTTPKLRGTEYVKIGPGYLKRMGRSWWFFGWHGSLGDL